MAGGWRVTPIATQVTAQATQASTSQGTTCIGSLTTAFVKGAWTTLVASLAADCTTITVQVCTQDSAGTALALDIGTGPSGSEVVTISNINFSNISQIGAIYTFPLAVAAGTRIAGRMSSNQTSDAMVVQILTTADTYLSAGQGSGIDTYGFNTGTNLGTAVDPGASANTKGAYATIASSTTADLTGITLYIDQQGNVTGTSTIVNWLIDIAVGAASSEIVVVPNLWITAWSSTISILPVPLMPHFPVRIPAGSRIACRAQCNKTGAVDRLIGCTIYGARL